MPIGVAPMGFQKLAHPDGEVGIASAASSMGIIYTLSTLSTASIEEVRKEAPDANLWFQLYVNKDRHIVEDLVRRAERCHYSVLVLTVDAPILGRRLDDIRNNFTLPPHLRFSNFDPYEQKSNTGTDGAVSSNIFKFGIDSSLNWKDLRWLIKFTTLPVVVKGIMSVEDARMCADVGAAAVWVSNHGGRQLDGVPASIDVLEEIVSAVSGRCEVYMDSGVTQGTDVFKALALGANMVFVGRPLLWGLVYGGEAGARKILEILRTELGVALTLSGCPSIGDIKKEMIVHQSICSKL